MVRACGARQRATTWWTRLAPYLPLAASIAEIPWLVFCVMMLLFMVGDTRYTSTPEKERLFGAIVALPSALGLLCAIVIFFAGLVRTVAQRICFTLGCLLCAGVLYAMAAGWIR